MILPVEVVEETCHDTPETKRDCKEPFANNIMYALKEITMNEAIGDINNKDYNSYAGSGDAPTPCLIVPCSANWPRRALIAPKSLLVGLVTQTVFILLIFKICGSSKLNNLWFDQNHQIEDTTLLLNISTPYKYRTEMVLYSKAYGSQFSEEK